MWGSYDGDEEEWKAVVNGISTSPVKLEVNSGNFRDSIIDAVFLLGMALGRRSIVQRWREMAGQVLPFPRNPNFAGQSTSLRNSK